MKDFIQKKIDERNKYDRNRPATALQEIMPLNASYNAEIQAYLARDRERQDLDKIEAWDA